MSPGACLRMASTAPRPPLRRKLKSPNQNTPSNRVVTSPGAQNGKCISPALPEQATPHGQGWVVSLPQAVLGSSPRGSGGGAWGVDIRVHGFLFDFKRRQPIQRPHEWSRLQQSPLHSQQLTRSPRLGLCHWQLATAGRQDPPGLPVAPQGAFRPRGYPSAQPPNGSTQSPRAQPGAWPFRVLYFNWLVTSQTSLTLILKSSEQFISTNSRE